MARFTFNISALSDGLGFVIVAMGVFGFTEVIVNLELKENREILTKKVKNLWLTKSEFKAAAPAALRGTMVGSMLGILPGGGALFSSFAAYTLEKKVSKNPRSSGKGPSKESPRRKRPTMPGRRHPSFRFSPSASPPIR